MWIELRLSGLSRSSLQATTRDLFALGCTGVQEDHLPGAQPALKNPWDKGPDPQPSKLLLLRAWFEEESLAHLERRLPLFPCSTTVHQVVEEDWATSYQAHFPRIQVNNQITIGAPWNAEPGDLVIDPGQGFGTGDHITTRQILQRLCEFSLPQRAYDIGCGSGILAIAAARLGVDTVLGVDVEEPAILEARHNAALNDVRVEFSTQPIEEISPGRSLVLANLHAELIVTLWPQLQRLASEHLLLAGIMHSKIPLVAPLFEPHFHIAHQVTDGQWASFHLIRS